jgi:hypothetical protein
MRHSFVGALLAAGLVIAVAAERSSSEQPAAAAEEVPARPGGGELIAYVTAAEGQPNIVTVIDPRQRVLAVYHVDRTTGEITFKSVRNITWDLQMSGYNTGKPLPEDVRSGLQR